MDEKTGVLAIVSALMIKFACGLAILLAVCVVLFIFSAKFRSWIKNSADKRDVKVAAKQAEKAAKKEVK